MTLDAHTAHPSDRAYVVKLHRDALARPDAELAGRVEHLVSGDHADFASADELVAWLERHAQPHPVHPQED